MRQDFFVVSRGREGGLAENLHFLPAALKSHRIMATTDTERPCFAELEIIIILLRVETAKKERGGAGAAMAARRRDSRSVVCLIPGAKSMNGGSSVGSNLIRKIS